MRLLAYDSAATNLVPGDANAHRDVFVLFRAGPLGGLTGRLALVSVSSSGGQANGDSSRPSVDGTTGSVPHCVAFESTATNLNPRDGSPDPDIYLRDLRRHSTTLVSVGVRAARDPSIDGRCHSVTFTDGRHVLLRDLQRRRTYRVAAGSQADLQTDGKGLVWVSRGQVYQRFFRLTHAGLRFHGRPFLVSDTVRGLPGNGPSDNPAVDDHGRHVAFDSAASDLCLHRDCRFPFQYGERCIPSCRWSDYAPTGDANGAMRDVFLRSLAGPDRAPGRGLRLLSLTMEGQGNGPSTNPAITRAGQNVAFETRATNLNASGQPYFNFNGAVPDVMDWYLRPGQGDQNSEHTRLLLDSAAGSGLDPKSVFNGATSSPALSSRGNYVAFSSFESGLAGEANGPGIPDVFLRYAGPAPSDPAANR